MAAFISQELYLGRRYYDVYDPPFARSGIAQECKQADIALIYCVAKVGQPI
jgi:hypothetical protein